MRLLLLFLFFLPLSLYAQLFNHSGQFTIADTLRGSVTPERAWWDVVYYDLHITPQFSNFSVKGVNTIHFKIVQPPERYLQIDLQEPMVIEAAFLNEKTVFFERRGNIYLIEIPFSLRKSTAQDKKIHQLKLVFQGVPKPALQPPWDGGVVWSKDKKGNPWIGTACQGMGASSWWPCKDHQSDKADSATLHITTPDTLMNVSNGRLRNVQKDANQTKTWTWHVSKPISTYNLTMNIGKYAYWQDTIIGKNGLLTLDYYVLEEERSKAQKQFTQIKPMLHAFEYWFGAYPFYEDGYKIVQTSYLGMEHQSAIAYGNNFENGYQGEDLSETGEGLKWDFILVHESGHEWFGNNVTANDIADLWIHEAFTTYSEYLYMENMFGADVANRYLIGLRKKIMNREPIIGPYGVNKEGSSDMYFKGSNLIHTLRCILNNDSLFRELLLKINKDFRYQSIDTKVLEKKICAYAGHNASKILNQYLRGIQIPVLEYTFEEGKKGKEMLYRWNNCNPDFDMKIRIPINDYEFQWVQPGREWKRIAADFSNPSAISSLFDAQFYVEYKKVMQ